MEEVKMLEQVSAVKQAEQDLRDIEKEEVVDLTGADEAETSEQMKQFEDSIITGDQLAQLRALYNRKPKQLVRKHAKIGRNDPCICGSGKKFKNCCMKTGEFDGLREI